MDKNKCPKWKNNFKNKKNSALLPHFSFYSIMVSFLKNSFQKKRKKFRKIFFFKNFQNQKW